MRNVSCLLFTFCTLALAASADDRETAGEPSRAALIKSALTRDRGDITAMEPATEAGRGIYLGYSSGAVLNCFGDNLCREFDGTPGNAVAGAVRDLAVTRRDGRDILWAAYPHGIIYRCSDYVCREFNWNGENAE